MTNEITTQETNSLAIIEGLSLDGVQQSMKAIQQFQGIVQNALVPNHDYGESFFGANKPSLLKPGAEKILMLLGLSSEYEIIEKIQDYEDGFFAYTIRCVLKKNGQVITEGLGHCNSKEKKYTSDKQDVFMLGNTCLKMAKKRAQVDAALTVGSLSDIFTQDLEDMAQFNQSERLETMTIDDAESMKIGFGKHRGKTIKEIHSMDIRYVKWLAEKAKEPVVKKAANMVLNGKENNKGPVNEESKVEGMEPIDSDELEGTPFADNDIPF